MQVVIWGKPHMPGTYDRLCLTGRDTTVCHASLIITLTIRSVSCYHDNMSCDKRGAAPTAAFIGELALSQSCYTTLFYTTGEALHAAAFSGDGSLLAVAAGDTVTLWQPVTNALLATLSGALFLQFSSLTCIESAYLWLEDVNSVRSTTCLGFRVWSVAAREHISLHSLMNGPPFFIRSEWGLGL